MAVCEISKVKNKCGVLEESDGGDCIDGFVNTKGFTVVMLKLAEVENRIVGGDCSDA